MEGQRGTRCGHPAAWRVTIGQTETTADWAGAPRGGWRGQTSPVPPATFARRPVRRSPASRSAVARDDREHVRREPFSGDVVAAIGFRREPFSGDLVFVSDDEGVHAFFLFEGRSITLGFLARLKRPDADSPMGAPVFDSAGCHVRRMSSLA